MQVLRTIISDPSKLERVQVWVSEGNPGSTPCHFGAKALDTTRLAQLPVTDHRPRICLEQVLSQESAKDFWTAGLGGCGQWLETKSMLKKKKNKKKKKRKKRKKKKTKKKKKKKDFT
ncbi:TPA: hypothetical protein ACH3X1_003267 [Trebouxia sp. C0004]